MGLFGSGLSKDGKTARKDRYDEFLDSLCQLELAPAQIVDLPVEQLARFVLLDLIRQEDAGIVVGNWAIGVKRRYQGDPEVLLALGEALAWLNIQMYLVDDLAHANEYPWRRVSRAGAAWLNTPPAPAD